MKTHRFAFTTIFSHVQRIFLPRGFLRPGDDYRAVLVLCGWPSRPLDQR